MKKILLLSCMFVISYSNAQTDSVSIRKPFTFGIKAGGVFSDAKTPVAYENKKPITDNKTSFYAGLQLDYSINYWLSASLGSEYLQTGADKTNDGFSKLEFSQVVVPLSLKLYPSDFIYFQAGGYLSFITDVTVDTYSGEGRQAYLDNEDFDYGMLFGVGGEFKHFFIEAKYNIGFKDLLSYNRSNYEPDFDPIIDGGQSDPYYKNRFLQIGIGYKF